MPDNYEWIGDGEASVVGLPHPTKEMVDARVPIVRSTGNYRVRMRPNGINVEIPQWTREFE